MSNSKPPIPKQAVEEHPLLRFSLRESQGSLLSPASISSRKFLGLSSNSPMGKSTLQVKSMGATKVQAFQDNGDGFSPFRNLAFAWNPNEGSYPVFASVNQIGVGFNISANPSNTRDNGIKIPYTDLYLKPSPEFGYRIVRGQEDEVVEGEEGALTKREKKRGGFKIKFKVGNPSLRRLVSGAVAGAVSRTAVAPLETVRTHLMVGSNGNSSTEVFDTIMKTEGWKGLFRGNFVNVIRVAPSKAIELFAFDTAKKVLAPKSGEQPKIPIPASLIAGAFAGFSSTLCTYPLELLKTRLTIQREAYNNLLDAFVKILREEGPAELYRGLTPSLIGVVPYAATNYFAYDTLRKVYKKAAKRDDIGHIATLLIGSAAGAISSTATFPLEVARKHMQVGAVGGRQVYDNMLHALLSILEKEGVGGLYKGLGPSCLKLVPAAGISFMCYEACKKILVEREEDEEL